MPQPGEHLLGHLLAAKSGEGKGSREDGADLLLKRKPQKPTRPVQTRLDVSSTLISSMTRQMSTVRKFFGSSSMARSRACLILSLCQAGLDCESRVFRNVLHTISLK